MSISMGTKQKDTATIKTFIIHKNCGLSLHISPNGDIYQNTVHGMIKIPNPPVKI